MTTSSYRVRREDLICNFENIRAAADNRHDSYFFPISTLHASAVACLYEQFQRQSYYRMFVFLVRAVVRQLHAAFDRYSSVLLRVLILAKRSLTFYLINIQMDLLVSS
jgi:hypothetical protein